MSTNIRAFDTLNLADILIDDDAPLSTQRDGNDTYEDDFEHETSFPDKEFDEDNKDGQETEDEILAKYARAFEESDSKSDESSDYATPRPPDSEPQRSSVIESPQASATQDDLPSLAACSTSNIASPSASPRQSLPQSTTTSIPKISSDPVSSCTPVIRTSYLKVSRPKASSGMFSKVSRVPKPSGSSSAKLRETESSSPQPTRQLPEYLISEVYALHAKLEAAYSAPFVDNARKITNMVPQTKQQMNDKSYTKPIKDFIVPFNDYNDTVDSLDSSVRMTDVHSSAPSAPTEAISQKLSPTRYSTQRPKHRPRQTKEKSNRDPVTTSNECDSSITAKSIYATFLSDLLGLMKERSNQAQSIEELTMHRVLAQYVQANFVSEGSVESITADMIYAAKCNVKKGSNSLIIFLSSILLEVIRSRLGPHAAQFFLNLMRGKTLLLS